VIMPYKSPTDMVAWRKQYYRDHREKMREQAASYYEDHKNDAEFKLKRASYMRKWRNKLR
jgi:hypothetical protein